MTLSSLSIYGYLWILTKAKIMLFFSLPTTKAYVEFIGREKARTYLQCIYCKVKQWIQRELSQTIKSRCACVWIYIWWIYMVANLILLCSLKTYLSFETWKHFCKRTWAILFISLSFSGRHLNTHCFKYLKHFCVHFFLFSFFMNNFCIAHASFSQQKL